MRDFSLAAYRAYAGAIAKSFPLVLRFDHFFERPAPPPSFAMFRHDVDRRPWQALATAKIEADLGIRASYYFRAKPGLFVPEVIREVAQLGHEVGYHYECLSDTNGDLTAAFDEFERQLGRFRSLVPVKTVCMHGRPAKRFDNRDMWRAPEHRALLRDRFGLYGELYLDIDYRDILYLTDTGRNWSRGGNLRDHVETLVHKDFASGEALLGYLSNAPHPRLVFSAHPQRWFEDGVGWYASYLEDLGTNVAKSILRVVR